MPLKKSTTRESFFVLVKAEGIHNERMTNRPYPGIREGQPSKKSMTCRAFKEERHKRVIICASQSEGINNDRITDRPYPGICEGPTTSNRVSYLVPLKKGATRESFFVLVRAEGIHNERMMGRPYSLTFARAQPPTILCPILCLKLSVFSG